MMIHLSIKIGLRTEAVENHSMDLDTLDYVLKDFTLISLIKKGKKGRT